MKKLRKALALFKIKFTYPDVLRHLDHYVRNQDLKKEELLRIQFMKLKKIISYSYENIPFYRNLWNSCGVDVEIKSIKDFEKFPIVTKAMLKKGISKGEFEIEKRFSFKSLKELSTTGSSGEPLRFFHDKSYYSKYTAKLMQVDLWHGYEAGDKQYRVWRAPFAKRFKDRLREFFSGVRCFSVYDSNFVEETAFSDQRLREVIRDLNRFKPSYINGFSSSLDIISRYIIKNSVEIKFKPRSITTGAEALSLDQRERIAKAFNDCLVFNRYGGTESSLIAHECPEQASSNHFLHLNVDNNLLEVVDGNGKVCRDGEPGSALITVFDNFTVPFIRYENGDLVTKVSADCKCGLPYPMIRNIQGRKNEVFYTSSGSMITTHLWQNIFKRYQFIDVYQLEQISVEKVVARVVINDLLFCNDDFLELKRKVKDSLEGADVNWIFMKEIPRGAGGKFRQCISRVNGSELCTH